MILLCNNKKKVCLALISFLFFTLLPLIAIAQNPQPHSYFLEDGKDPQNLSSASYEELIKYFFSVKKKTSPFKLKIWSKKKDYTLCQPMPCDTIRHFVQSEKSGYLYHFHLDPEKNLWMLFPGDFIKRNNSIQKGEVVTILDASGSTTGELLKKEGTYYIKGILTSKEVNWRAFEKKRDFKWIKRGNKKKLRELLLEENLRLKNNGIMAQALFSFTLKFKSYQSLYPEEEIKHPPPEKPIDIIGTTGREDEDN